MNTENYLLPPEIWKISKKQKKLTSDFLTWFFRHKADFVKRAEKYFPGISAKLPNDWTDDERLLFSLYLQRIAKIDNNR